MVQRAVIFAVVSCLSNISLERISSALFFFNDTATTEIYTLSLHDALPISWVPRPAPPPPAARRPRRRRRGRSEEHTSELQSRLHLVCRLLLEKKKRINNTQIEQIHLNQDTAILIITKCDTSNYYIMHFFPP